MRTAASLVALIVASALTACSPGSETPQEPSNTAVTAPVSTANDVHTFTVGDFSAIALRDGALDFPNDNKVFGVGHTTAEVAALLTDAGLPTDYLDLSIQPLLVKTGESMLLFDTGAGANMGSSGGRLPASMAAAGIDPASVTDVFISHAHGDHVGGLLNADGALAFPNAAIHISSPEWAFLRGMSAETAAGVAIADAPVAQASRRALLARSAESGQRIYAVHFPFPGLGKVERGDDGFVWVPE